jgi:acyl carrier protein
MRNAIILGSLALVLSAAAYGYAAQDRRPTPVAAASPANSEHPFLLAIEDVFFISGRGAVVTGRIETGTVRVGDEVEIVGLGQTRRTRVLGVEMFRKMLSEGRAGDNVGITLAGVTRDQLKRGQVLARPGSIDTCTEFEAMVTPLPRDLGLADFYFRTADVGGRISFARGGRLAGGKVPARITLFGLIALKPGQQFVVRQSGHTIGTGTAGRCLSGQSGQDVAGKVAKIVSDLVGVEPRRVTPAARFREDLGADSLDFVELIMAWEEEFGIEISDAEAARIRTVGDATRYVKAAISRPVR